MASKENKTSKTARVMNLLSKKADGNPAEETAEGNAAPASTAPVPPVITSMGPDAAVADQIKDALEGALAEELAPLAGESPMEEAPAEELPVEEAPVEEAAEEPVQAEPEPEPEPEPDPEPEPIPEPAPEPDPVPDPVAEESAHEGSDETKRAPASPINVMQVLVEEKAAKYIKMFGLCQCDRCLEDVKALTLNHLPPKYVVLEEGDLVPRLTFYEGKFSSDITAQLLHACRMVMERPHHNR